MTPIIPHDYNLPAKGGKPVLVSAVKAEYRSQFVNADYHFMHDNIISKKDVGRWKYFIEEVIGELNKRVIDMRKIKLIPIVMIDTKREAE